MKADLAAKMGIAPKRITTPKTGVTGVTGVTCETVTCDKSLMLQLLRPLRLKNDKNPKSALEGVTETLNARNGIDTIEVEERKGMAMDGVPELYLDDWARLQCQRPAAVSDDEWRQAIIDAGLFLDCWGSPALELGWTPADLFDAARDGSPGGLVWRIKGQGIRALGDGHAVTNDGRRI